MTKTTREQAHTVTCPNCQAQPGRRCSQPTDTGRRDVAWVHLAREDAYRADRAATEG
jgi:hypothetical protein